MREDVDQLVWFMCQHYRHIFKIPLDLRMEVEQRLTQQHQHKRKVGVVFHVVPPPVYVCVYRVSGH